MSDKVEIVSDQHDGNGDVLLLDGLVHVFVQSQSWLGFEFNWGFIEDSVALSFDLGIGVVETNIWTHPVFLGVLRSLFV